MARMAEPSSEVNALMSGTAVLTSGTAEPHSGFNPLMGGAAEPHSGFNPQTSGAAEPLSGFNPLDLVVDMNHRF